MDLITGLKSEIFRPLVTLAVPSSIAIAPFVLVVLARFSEVERYWRVHPSAIIAVILVVIVAGALILEDVGSRIEKSCWNRLIKKGDSQFETNWRKYLRLKTTDEVVGRRYLQIMHTRMKFELAAAPALVCHTIGLNWANHQIGFLSTTEIWVVSCGLIILMAYLLIESYTNAKALAILRRDIIAAVGVQPRAAD